MEEFKTLIKHCRDDYSWLDDDTDDYMPGWVPIVNETGIDNSVNTSSETSVEPSERKITPFTYQDSIDLASAPYAGILTMYKGGGYTFSFKRSARQTARLLRVLEKQDWVTVQTRSVFLEFTLYNANVNLFGSCIMLIEFMATGSALQKMEVKVGKMFAVFSLIRSLCSVALCSTNPHSLNLNDISNKNIHSHIKRVYYLNSSKAKNLSLVHFIQLKCQSIPTVFCLWKCIYYVM